MATTTDGLDFPANNAFDEKRGIRKTLLWNNGGWNFGTPSVEDFDHNVRSVHHRHVINILDPGASAHTSRQKALGVCKDHSVLRRNQESRRDVRIRRICGTQPREPSSPTMIPLAIKADYVREHHLGGIMFWELSQDYDDELLDAIVRAMRR